MLLLGRWCDDVNISVISSNHRLHAITENSKLLHSYMKMAMPKEFPIEAISSQQNRKQNLEEQHPKVVEEFMFLTNSIWEFTPALLRACSTLLVAIESVPRNSVTEIPPAIELTSHVAKVEAALWTHIHDKNRILARLDMQHKVVRTPAPAKALFPDVACSCTTIFKKRTTYSANKMPRL